MEIFNIHIFEFLLIAGLALVVFGPERLPELGRLAGKQVARFLAWQQQSPELKLINDVRSEIEQEIASLRDELVRTRNQLDLERDGTLSSIREELRPMLSLRDPLKDDPKPADAARAGAAEAPASELPKTWDMPDDDPDLVLEELPPDLDLAVPPELPDAPELSDASELLDAPELLAEPPLRTAPEGTVPAAARPHRMAATEPTSVFERPSESLSYLEERRRSLHDPPVYAEAPPESVANGHSPAPGAELAHIVIPAVTAEEVRLIMARLEQLSADLQTLISGLQAEGVLGAAWTPEAAVAEQEGIEQ